MTDRQITMSVKITRNYGKHAIEFGMSETAIVTNGSERRDFYNGLVKQINDQITVYENVFLNGVSLPQLDNSTVEGQPIMQAVPATKIVVESKNGKRLVSVKGGRWSLHGVPVYDDSCVSDIDFSSYDYGQHDITHHNLRMVVDVVNGKPKRVVSLS